MSFDMEQVMHTFIEEARELLEAMEASLLILENNPDDNEHIDAVFRAAHTIKGSAGLFGLMEVVAFTHVVEDVLDRVRSGRLAIDRDLIALLLKSGDHIGELIKVFAIEKTQLDSATLQRESDLLKCFDNYRPVTPELLVTSSNNNNNVEVCNDDSVTYNLWHISLRFGTDVFRSGMDPMSFIKYLSSLGTIVGITTFLDAMPEPEAMDPESCYLSFEIEFDSNADKQAIADVFRFVNEDCAVHILPPHSKLFEYVELIKSLPADNGRLGEILVAAGVLTQQELEQSLELQRNSIDVSGKPSLLGDILVSQRSVEPEIIEAALDKQAKIKEQKSKENLYLRVQADKLDSLINLIGELVIAGAGASLLAREAGNASLYEANSVVSDLIEEIRDNALRLRMVPIGDTFNRFQRVVRDVSRELGKEIELVISGAETEVDKTVVEKIADPLVHLLRNSMDHGIEMPERRLATGKPARGKLTLNAYHDSGSIVIEIEDDGSGLNRDRILAKAIERGLVSTEAQLSDQEIYKLIFEPGFSTAETVTNLSGRGVGMDVVKRNILSLRGTIDLDSKPGLGTHVRIRLPLTLAIIDGFLVGVGHGSYVVPLELVRECVELSDTERTLARERNYLNLRGEVLPLIFLRDHFDLPDYNGRRENVVIVRTAGRSAGLVVDDLQGEFQTVIKPLGKLFTGLRGISGSTILGSGAVALILDVPAMVQQIIQTEGRPARLHATQGR